MGFLANFTKKETSKTLTLAFERLSFAKDLESITTIVAETARKLSGADGATFVLRDGDRCYYVDENSISPLWKGQKFPMSRCISGWSMNNQKPVFISDIYKDDRIPHDAYRPTFVKSLCIVPIRVENPIGAIGNYWSNGYTPNEEEIKTLQVLANSTAIALENLELKLGLKHESKKISTLISRNNDLEVSIRSIAHDLRTPLGGMTGLAELLKMRLADKLDEDSAQLLNLLLQTGQQAGQQIEQMLDLYRANSGAINKHSLNITKITEELIHIFKLSPQNQNVQFDVWPDLKAYGDPPLIRVVMDNLLSNAIKYSSKKSNARIEIGLEATTRSFDTFFVRDNGDGFDSSESEKLFQPLARLHSQNDFEGTGLGLASVAKIIKVHGGKFRAEGAPNAGATFFFSLPKKA